MPQPWERQDGEGEKAYAAFLVYLNIGLGRTILEAYRRHKGDPDVPRASGIFSNWARKFRWADRAASWDRNLVVRRLEGAEQASRRSGVVWAERRESEAEKALELGRRLMERAEALARFPIHRQETAGEGGRTTIVEPLDASTLARASIVGVRAYAMIRAAIDHAAPPDDWREDPEFRDFDPATCDDLATLERFIARYGGGGR